MDEAAQTETAPEVEWNEIPALDLNDSKTRPQRVRLPDTRESVTKRFEIRAGGGEPMRLYVIVGLYDNGRVGEVFIRTDKVGTLANGAIDGAMIAMSIGLQCGVPLQDYTAKFLNMNFEPSGLTGDPEFRIAKSVLDLVARYLDARFPNGYVKR